MTESLLKLDVRKIYSVFEVTQDIRQLLEDTFPAVWIQGEVSNFKPSSAGHYYFTLKDADAQIRVVMFKGSNRLLKFQIEDGQELIIHGRMSVYSSRGEYQLLADGAEPKGLGALQLAFEQLKKKLEAQGLFSLERKRALPYLPRKIGIITSSKGAVLHDILNVVKRRFPTMDILIHPVKVQGAGAREEISEAIIRLNQREDLDVIIVGRGGGSLEDLWAFNEEIVVRAIAASRIPIISAVGHETDFTLADLAADLRAPTPSAAAELVVPQKIELELLLTHVQTKLKQALHHLINTWNDQVSFLKRQFKDPRFYFANLSQRLDDLRTQLFQSQSIFFHQGQLRLSELKGRLLFQNRLPLLAQRLNSNRKRLQVLSPIHQLQRGYAIAFRTGDHFPVTTIQNLHPGEVLTLKLADGEINVQILPE